MKRDDPRVPASTHGPKRVDVRKHQSSPYFCQSVSSRPAKKTAILATFADRPLASAAFTDQACV